MTHYSPNTSSPSAHAQGHDPDLTGSIFDFTPVPLNRCRHDGWSAEVQRRFIAALVAMGSVGAAARAVGIGRVSAYRLRARALQLGGDAESFAAAWDNAVYAGRSRQYDIAMDRALNGVTTVRVRRGGSVCVETGPDMRLIHRALRELPEPPVASR